MYIICLVVVYTRVICTLVSLKSSTPHVHKLRGRKFGGVLSAPSQTLANILLCCHAYLANLCLSLWDFTKYPSPLYPVPYPTLPRTPPQLYPVTYPTSLCTLSDFTLYPRWLYLASDSTLPCTVPRITPYHRRFYLIPHLTLICTLNDFNRYATPLRPAS